MIGRSRAKKTLVEISEEGKYERRRKIGGEKRHGEGVDIGGKVELLCKDRLDMPIR